jgi:hypothetical protein
MYCSSNVVRMIKSRRMRWARHVAHMGERRDVYSVLVGKPEGKRPLGRLGWDVRACIRSSMLKIRAGGGDW